MLGGTEVHRLIVRLLGDTKQYQASMVGVQRTTAATAASVQRSTAAMGTAFTTMAGGGILAATAAVGSAVRAFANFDQAMTESTSIMQATTEQMGRMRDLALELSSAAPQSATELARSYFYLASAGLDAEQSMAALETVRKFATAGAFDMANATDLLTDAQSALGLSIRNDVVENMRNMTRVSDVLVKANTLANATVEQFSLALTNEAGAALKNFNKDVEEGVAVLAALADQGIKAQVAGHGLGRVIRLMTKAALDNAEEHKRLGFRVYDTTGRMRNMADIVENLERIVAGMSDEVRSATLDALGFEARIQGIILPLLGTSDAIRQYEEALRAAGGTTESVADKQMESLSNQAKALWNNISNAATVIVAEMVPALEDLLAVANSMAAPLAKLIAFVERWSLIPAASRALDEFQAGTRPGTSVRIPGASSEQFGRLESEVMEEANRRARASWWRKRIPFSTRQIAEQREREQQTAERARAANEARNREAYQRRVAEQYNRVMQEANLFNDPSAWLGESVRNQALLRIPGAAGSRLGSLFGQTRQGLAASLGAMFFQQEKQVQQQQAGILSYQALGAATRGGTLESQQRSAQIDTQIAQAKRQEERDRRRERQEDDANQKRDALIAAMNSLATVFTGQPIIDLDEAAFK